MFENSGLYGDVAAVASTPPVGSNLIGFLDRDGSNARLGGGDDDCSEGLVVGRCGVVRVFVRLHASPRYGLTQCIPRVPERRCQNVQFPCC